MNIELAILHHYGSGKVFFMIQAGKLVWEDPIEPEPTNEQIIEWWTIYLVWLGSQPPEDQEQKIQDEIRRQAVDALILGGELPPGTV